MPNHTDHGTLHTVNVLRYINYLTREYPITFTKEEKFILSLATIFHDIGCLVKRERHNETSARLLNGKYFKELRMELGPIFSRALIQTVLAHGRSFNLLTTECDPCPEIRLKLISSIFRLADACDQNSRRVREIVFKILTNEKLLNEESSRIWKAHLNVENIVVNETKLEIRVYNIELAKKCIDDFTSELPAINEALKSITKPTFTVDTKIIKNK